LKVRFVDRIEGKAIDARFLLVAGQTLFRARFFSELVVGNFLAAHIFVERDPVIIELLA